MNILVAGGKGFIGSHLVKYLEAQGHTVDTTIDSTKQYDEFYQLAADHGGIKYLTENAFKIMINNAEVNHSLIQYAMIMGVKRYFFASSVCVYPNMQEKDTVITEEEAYPALPNDGYGWEKLFNEQLLVEAGKITNMQIRIGRLDTIYGEGQNYVGEKAKVIPALCRKIALAEKQVEMWGDGSASRPFLHVDDCVRAIDFVMHSDETSPVNIGTEDSLTIQELTEQLIAISGKELTIKSVPGVVGVNARKFNYDRLAKLGFTQKITLGEGLTRTYNWIKEELGKSHI